MFTAEMVLDLVKDTRKTCKGLDEWIERDVVNHFKKYPNLPMEVAQVALQVKAWPDEKFREEMEDRGFIVSELKVLKGVRYDLYIYEILLRHSGDC